MKSLKNTFLFLFLINLSGAFAFAQEKKESIDSIEFYYSIAKDKTRILDDRLTAISSTLILLKNDTTNNLYLKAINSKSFLLSKSKQFDSAIVFANLLLNKSTNAKNIKMQKLALRKLAIYNRLNSDLVSSFNYYVRLKDISMVTADTLSAVRALQHIARTQNIIGLPFESETSAVECLKLLDAIKDTPDIIESKVGIYNQLGIIYKDLKNYERAIELYDRALSKTNDASYIATLSNNKANVYREQGRLMEAESILNAIYVNVLDNKDKEIKNRALDNLGFVQSKLDLTVGVENLNKALLLREADRDIRGLYTSNMHLAEYYLDRNNFTKAKFHSQEAYQMAKKINSTIYKIDAMALLGKSTNDSNLSQYIYLKDSLQEAKLMNTNKYASVKYDYAKQELLAKENELEKEKQKRLKFIYMALGLLLTLVAIFLYFILKAQHKKDKLQQVFTTEARISKKVHDEVANDVYHVMAKLQSETTTTESILDDLESIYSKTRDISRENNAVVVTENFEEVLTDLLLNYKNNTTNVITKNLSKIDWQSFSKLKKMTIYRVLQELMVNMRKHSKASYVIINFEKLKDKLIISYNDNGVGSTFKKANGLENVENRISAIKGIVIFETEANKGFKAKITV